MSIASFRLVFVLSAAAAAQTVPVNSGFEQGPPGGKPAGWTFTSTAAGYTATVVAEAKTGRYAAMIKGSASLSYPDSGELLQTISAEPYRGKAVRFRATAKAQTLPGSFAGIEMRVDQPGGIVAYYDDMEDRPIGASWQTYELLAQVPEDAESISFGFLLSGGGSAWVDDTQFEIVTGLPSEPARPLDAIGMENVVAFTRLFGYVRHFHPSDEAQNVDWNAFAAEGVRIAESASGPADLAAQLQKYFEPIAPTVRVFATDAPPVEPLRAPSGATRMLRWRHSGLGGNPMFGYESTRVAEALPAEPPPPFIADLGAGIACEIPTAVYADETRTLPRATAPPFSPDGRLGTITDRATRMSAIVLAWNVFQHFFPYFDVVETDWPAMLRKSLAAAAESDDRAEFVKTLRRLLVGLHDGHGMVAPSVSGYGMPVAWDWIEDRIIVTHVGDKSLDLARGDAILSLDGVAVEELIARYEELIPAATAQLKRYRAVREMAGGPGGSVAVLEVEPYDAPGTRKIVNVKRLGSVREPRPEKIAELEPGIWYVDIDRINDFDWRTALPQLRKARGIVFDLRGYPRGMAYFSSLSEQPLESAHWDIPDVRQPDHVNMQFTREGWTIPVTESLPAKRAVITDARAISYAETVLGIFEAYHLAEIVGGPSAGTNGNVNPFRVAGGYLLYWTGMRVLKHDGSQHHGVGIKPTIPVPRTRAGVAAGRDEFLERAIEAVK